MIEKMMKFLKDNKIGKDYKPWREDQLMVRKMDEEFSIIIDGITMFFESSKTFKTETLIEISKHGDLETIDFRTQKDLHQTNFVTIDIDKMKNAEWEINGEYYYPGE